jgi:hypothetical protein
MRPAVAPKSIALLAIVASAAVLLAVASYQYSTGLAGEIEQVAASSIQSNAKIQAHDMSRVLLNKVDAVNNNLRVMSGNPIFNDPAVLEQGKQPT